MQQGKTIVTVAPTCVDRDSRTSKQAASLSRFGYRSIVVEIAQSRAEHSQLPFELKSIYPLCNVRSVLNKVKQSLFKPHVFDTTSATWGVQSGSVSTIVFNEEKHVGFARRFFDLVRFLAYLVIYIYYDVLLVLLNTPRASLYYLHGPYHFVAVYILSQMYKATYIYDAHDFYSGIERPDALSTYERNWRIPFSTWLERACVRHCSAVVTVSEGLAEMLRDTFDCKPIVIRNVHDFRLDCHPNKTIREELGLLPDDFLVAVIGQAKPGMAIKQTISAISRLPSYVHLVFLGRGYERYLPNLGERDLSQRIHVLQPVKPSEVVPFVKSADISLLPYYAYTFNYSNCLPNGFFQSIAAELPILYPGLPQITKLAEQYNMGIEIDPLSPESTCDAIQKLLLDKKLRMAYRHNLQQASQKLNGEQEEKVLKNLIAEALGIP